MVSLLSSNTETATKECVILLHGLARTDRSMAILAEALNEAGYQAINHGYPSTRHPIEKLASEAIETALLRCPEQTTVHFVTHSMGGILVRQYLSQRRMQNLGRVVMLGPPNQGSQVVDKLRHLPVFEWLNGPAGLQLGTGDLSVPKQLGPAQFEVGVIAGTRSINLLLSMLLPGPNDGKVTVENTKLAGMKDHIALPVSHPLMMRNQKVIEQVIHFLRYGAFQKD